MQLGFIDSASRNLPGFGNERAAYSKREYSTAAGVLVAMRPAVLALPGSSLTGLRASAILTG
jgi:hypothetical protein